MAGITIDGGTGVYYPQAVRIVNYPATPANPAIYYPTGAAASAISTPVAHSMEITCEGNGVVGSLVRVRYHVNNGIRVHDASLTAGIPIAYWTAQNTATAPAAQSWPAGVMDYGGSSATVATTVRFTEWGQAEIEQEWRGIYDGSGWVPIKGVVYPFQPELSIGQRLKEIIASRCAPIFIKDRKSLDKAQDIRELRARETLRRVIGDEKFQQFIVRGHVTVRGKSGLVYQIFPGSRHANVYDKGKKIETLCVILRGDFPPTDSLIMRYLLILNNEELFRSYANRQAINDNRYTSVIYNAAEESRKKQQSKTLVEIYHELKGVPLAA